MRAVSSYRESALGNHGAKSINVNELWRHPSIMASVFFANTSAHRTGGVNVKRERRLKSDSTCTTRTEVVLDHQPRPHHRRPTFRRLHCRQRHPVLVRASGLLVENKGDDRW